MLNKRLRWKSRYSILAILFLAWFVSFLDRMAMPAAIPHIASEFHLTPLRSGIVMSAFFAGYALSQLPGGVLADRFGVRPVATSSLVWWSVFTALTAAAGTFNHMLVTRFAFGLGEGAFPAAAFKTVTAWFPRRERATANAVMLAANTLGAALSPLLVVGIMSVWGWRAVFYGLCIPGLIASALFWIFIRNRPSDSTTIKPEELTEIRSDQLTPAELQQVTARNSLREIWRSDVILYCLIYFSFDVAYWGFTSWLPTYLVSGRGLSMIEMGAAASLPFIAGGIGRIFGGWLSDTYFVTKRRQLVIITQIGSALFLYLTFWAPSLWLLLVFQTLAGLFVHVFISGFWALPMTTLPERVMGTATGFINTGAQIGGLIAPICVGALVEASGGHFQTTFLFLVTSVILSLILTLFLALGEAQKEPAALG